MGLQPGDDLLGPQLLGGELRQVQHDADGERVEVGVDEAAAGHAAGAADDLDVDAVGASHAEALVDHLLGQRQRLLHAERVVLASKSAVAAPPPWRGSC